MTVASIFVEATIKRCVCPTPNFKPWVQLLLSSTRPNAPTNRNDKGTRTVTTVINSTTRPLEICEKSFNF